MVGMLSTSWWYLLFLTSILGFFYTNYKLYGQLYYNSKHTKRPAQAHVLILSSWRSGSSFVGQLFNQNPEVFYLMEPTRHVWKRMPQQSSRLLHIPMRDLLRSIFLCDMSTFQPYLSQTRYVSNLFMWHESRALCSPPACIAFNRSDITHRLTCRRKCSKSPFEKIEEACKTYTHIVVKVVRFLELKVLYPLLADPQLNLKIIHLVRDPRAILSSREHVHFLKSDDRLISGGDKMPEPNIYQVMQKICQAQKEMYETAMHDMPIFLKERYMMVRYEDLVMDPLTYMQVLYRYVHLSMSLKIKSWAYNITHASVPEEKGFLPYSKDSKVLAQRWQYSLSFQKVKMIQDVCQEAMDVFGYQIVVSEEEHKKKAFDFVWQRSTNLVWQW